MRVEWKGRVAFAEIADALGVTTSQIMGVQAADDVLLVLFNEHEGDETLSSVVLRRGQDGVLFASTMPIRRPGLWESIKRHAEGELGS